MSHCSKSLRKIFYVYPKYGTFRLETVVFKKEWKWSVLVTTFCKPSPRRHGVAVTSATLFNSLLRSHDVAVMSKRRCYDAVCLLSWYMYVNNSVISVYCIPEGAEIQIISFRRTCSPQLKSEVMPLETKNTQNNENSKLGFKNLHIQLCILRGCKRPLISTGLSCIRFSK